MWLIKKLLNRINAVLKTNKKIKEEDLECDFTQMKYEMGGWTFGRSKNSLGKTQFLNNI